MQDVALEELVKRLRAFFKKEESKTYLYLSFFFLVFSFFLAFVIRPTLKSAFQANSRKQQLLRVTRTIELLITKAINLQAEAERFRDDFDLLYEAVPERVKISEVLGDITESLRKNNLRVLNAQVSNLELVIDKGDTKFKTVSLEYTINGKFSDFLKFMKEVQNQRRLKTFSEINFTRKGEVILGATGEANLDIQLKIEAYFL